jgi:hypothetical protein
MRKKVVVLLVVALVLIGAQLALVLPLPCPVNHAAFARIKEGMTREEVHAMLGVPPGDYRTRPPKPITGLAITDGTMIALICVRHTERWVGDEGAIDIDYSGAWGPPPAVPVKVTDMHFTTADPHHPRPVEVIRWRLNRLLGREPDWSAVLDMSE